MEKIKQSKDKALIIRLLDALKWKFSGRDHVLLAEFDIFKCLREGDGSKKHPIKLAWGKNTGRKTWKPEEEPSSLQYVLLETFENLFFTIVGRVIDSEFGKEMMLK